MKNNLLIAIFAFAFLLNPYHSFGEKVFGEGYTILINLGDISTYDEDVKILFNVDEKASFMRVSHTPDFTGILTEPIKPVKLWNLCKDPRTYYRADVECNPGRYKVYAQFFDNVGNISPTIVSSILLKEGEAPKVETKTEEVEKQPNTETQNTPVENNTDRCGFERSIQKGASGEDVKRLQEIMSTDYTIYPERMVTGNFGTLTQYGVGRFQIREGLIPGSFSPFYGIFGPKTQERFAEVYCGKPVSVSTTNKQEPNIQKEDNSSEKEEILKRLNELIEEINRLKDRLNKL